MPLTSSCYHFTHRFIIIILLLLFTLIIQTGCGRNQSKENLLLLPEHHFTQKPPHPGQTYFDMKEGSSNVTAYQGQTALITCVVRNIGNKSVSWLRHSYPIPLVLGLNNITNVKDPRISALHTFGSDEYVLRIRHTKKSDSGLYECQVAGMTTIYRIIRLEIVEPITQILGGPDIYVDRGSTLNVTCVVWAAAKSPEFIFWSHNHKIILFEGSETSKKVFLPQDQHGRFVSRLIIHKMDHEHAGVYSCEPASAKKANVTVHILNGTVLAVSDADDDVSDSPRHLILTTSTVANHILKAEEVASAAATSSVNLVSASLNILIMSFLFIPFWSS